MTDPRSHWPLAGYDELRDRLLAAYSSPDRGYHDLRHLEEVLDRLLELLSVEGAGVDRDAVLLAAWFHDAVYDGASDDEERSAELAGDALAGLDTALATEVARLVRITAAHQPADDDLAGQLLCDADLAILASDPERHASYVAGVRREYAAVPDHEFRQGRAAVLRALLAKPTLFHTTHARTAWEGAARANVTRELEELLP
ncbi:MAG TPA: hypothetical protein VFJ09_06845 [Nocardioidaceae bacterium]|nr:hypothetical protein [Nocardioidaceae bacterium]